MSASGGKPIPTLLGRERFGVNSPEFVPCARWGVIARLMLPAAVFAARNDYRCCNRPCSRRFDTVNVPWVPFGPDACVHAVCNTCWLRVGPFSHCPACVYHHPQSYRVDNDLATRAACAAAGRDWIANPPGPVDDSPGLCCPFHSDCPPVVHLPWHFDGVIPSVYAFHCRHLPETRSNIAVFSTVSLYDRGLVG
jgi:hypothetical protein